MAEWLCSSFSNDKQNKADVALRVGKTHVKGLGLGLWCLTPVSTIFQVYCGGFSPQELRFPDTYQRMRVFSTKKKTGNYHTIICPIGSIFTLIWFIRYRYYCHLQFLNNAIIVQTKVLVPLV